MSELNDIKKEFEALKKRNAPPAEFEALINRIRTHREKLLNEFHTTVPGGANHE